MKPILSMLILNLAAAAFAAKADANAIRIMPVGDSLTAGGYNLNKVWLMGSGYREKLKEILSLNKIDIDFVGTLSNGSAAFLDREHEGYSGFKIHEIAAKFEPNLTSLKPDIVLLMAGSNDLFQNHEISTAPQRLFAIVDKIRHAQPDTVIFIASVIHTNNPGFNSRIDAYNKRLRETAKTYTANNPGKFYFVDMADKTKFKPRDFTDGVHPTASAYQKMGVVWGEAVRLFLKSR